jgi:hypothetical protein
MLNFRCSISAVTLNDIVGRYQIYNCFRRTRKNHHGGALSHKSTKLDLVDEKCEECKFEENKETAHSTILTCRKRTIENTVMPTNILKRKNRMKF